MACNIPIVSVDVGDVREVCDGVEGCVISKTDPLSIAEAIKSTIGTHQRTQGRKNIERLKINKVAAEIKLLYKSLGLSFLILINQLLIKKKINNTTFSIKIML